MTLVCWRTFWCKSSTLGCEEIDNILLGIEVAQSRKGIFLSKSKYVLDFLEEISLLGCKAIMSNTPM